MIRRPPRSTLFPSTPLFRSVPELPFLAAALFRLLEEFPWAGDGLSRLERQALQALRDGPLPFAELFLRAHHRREEPVFLGDRKSTRLNSSHLVISYAVFCLK